MCTIMRIMRTNACKFRNVGACTAYLDRGQAATLCKVRPNTEPFSFCEPESESAKILISRH